jgi:hypothetical protein
MDSDELAMATAATFGEEVVTSTQQALNRKGTRSFGLNEYLAVGSFIVSLSQAAIACYQVMRSRKELADGLTKNIQSSEKLSAELQEKIIARLADIILQDKKKG